MPDPTIRLESTLSAEDRQTIIEGLVGYNIKQGYVWEHDPVNLTARAPDGRVIGGLIGEINLGWLFVSALWVDAEVRGSGIGSRLIREAEVQAKERGAVGIYLDTYSFQAKPFYERMGFHSIGELPDCPPGGAKYYFAKRVGA